MPVKCPEIPEDERELIDSMKSILKEVGRLGKVYKTVGVAASRAWHRITGGFRSVEAELVETSLVRITEGQSRDLAAHIRSYYAALKLMRLQAAQVVRNAYNMHVIPARIVSKVLGGARKADARKGASGEELGAVAKVERAASDIAGKQMEFVRPLTARFVGRVEEFFTEGGFVAQKLEAAADAIAALFGRTRVNQEAKAFIAAVQSVTGLSDEAAVAYARKLWQRHGDLFATGVTRDGRKTTMPDGTKMGDAEVARQVLETLYQHREWDTPTALTRWLTRVSELAVDRRAFPGGKNAAIDAVLGGTDPRVAEKVRRMMDFIDRESWSPRYASRVSPVGLVVNALFLGGAITPVKQLGAFATAIADLGFFTWLTGAISLLPRALRFVGIKGHDPVDWAISLALKEGGGGVGGISVPGVALADRFTRFINAGAAAVDFRSRLATLRSRYSRVSAEELPRPGEDADIDALRSRGFTENHIAAIINSKHEVPKLALAYYVIRSTDIGTGTPDALNIPPIQEHALTKILLPFSRFAVRMGSNVYQRMYRDQALRNWMIARTRGNPHPIAQAEAIAQGWKERARVVTGLDYRYLFALAASSALFEEVILDPAEDALMMPAGADPTLIEKTQALLQKAIDDGELTPAMIREEFEATFRAIDEVGALGVFFSLWERQIVEDKPADVTLEELVGRSPMARMLGTLQVIGQFGLAAHKNRNAINSEQFYLLVARDMARSGGPFVSSEPNLIGSSQFNVLEEQLNGMSGEMKRLVLDYLREQTLGRVMSRVYGYPLIRNDYIIALHVNTEHHNRLLIETLMRARDMSGYTNAGGVWRFPGPGSSDGTTVPPVSEKWQNRSFSLNVIEKTLMARYGFKTTEELYQKLVMKEFVNRSVGQSIVRVTHSIPEQVVKGDTITSPQDNQ